MQAPEGDECALVEAVDTSQALDEDVLARRLEARAAVPR
jgi:hypothetical protein